MAVMYYTIPGYQLVDVLFKRLMFVPLPLRPLHQAHHRGRMDLRRRCTSRQDTYSGRFHPSIVMQCQDCSTRRGLKLPTMEDTSSAAPCTIFFFVACSIHAKVSSNSFLFCCLVFLWAGVRGGKNSRLGWAENAAKFASMIRIFTCEAILSKAWTASAWHGRTSTLVAALPAISSANVLPRMSKSVFIFYFLRRRRRGSVRQ